MARLVRAATDRNPPTLGGGGCQIPQSHTRHFLTILNNAPFAEPEPCYCRRNEDREQAGDEVQAGQADIKSIGDAGSSHHHTPRRRRKIASSCPWAAALSIHCLAPPRLRSTPNPNSYMIPSTNHAPAHNLARPPAQSPAAAACSSSVFFMPTLSLLPQYGLIEST